MVSLQYVLFMLLIFLFLSGKAIIKMWFVGVAVLGLEEHVKVIPVFHTDEGQVDIEMC